MKKLQISLKPGERIYVNGAVLKVDRKVSIEFLNDVTFLLEHHVLHPDDTRTPLRQLYFIVQTLLIDPANGADARIDKSSLKELVMTDSIDPERRKGKSKKVRVVTVAPLMADAIYRIANEISVSVLFE